MASKLRLVVLGMMGRCPYGGQTWLYLNWIQAFTRLGHEVWYVEDDPAWPYDPQRDSLVDDCQYAVRHVASSLERIGLKDRWVYRLTGAKDKCWGRTPEQLDELYRSCDALLNIVGATYLREEHMVARRRIYVETDPVTQELRAASGDEAARQLFALHDQLFTYGENYGAPDCGVPLNGLTFHKTRQPIDLDLWPASYDPQARYFTTIGNYRQSGSDVVYQGQTYRWSKHHEWEKVVTLPQRVKQEFELATNAAGEDRAFLERHGWRLTSPLAMSLDIFGAYPEYFRRSRAQFTVAKDQNVRLRSGWFSERDVCYLASGKPVVTQETGFSNVLPTGQGLFGFGTLEEAVEAVNAINADYPRHCRAARALAEEWFAAPRIGARLLEEAGLA